MYKLKDLGGESLKGSVYEPEILKADQQIYRIDRVLRISGDKVYVK